MVIPLLLYVILGKIDQKKLSLRADRLLFQEIRRSIVTVFSF